MRIFWNPIIESIRRECDTGAFLTGCISPFCTLQGVEAIFEGECKADAGYVIARWRLKELVNGVGELEVYPYLKSIEVPLYIHYDLHSKLYLFSNGNALCGSGNATGKGLGLVDHANVESGVLVQMDMEDEVALKTLRDRSVRVTDDIYERFWNALSDYDDDKYPTFETDIYNTSQSKIYLISDLPATRTPDDFFKFYNSSADQWCGQEVERQRFINDACCLSVEMGLPLEAVAMKVGVAFRAIPFVQAIVNRIRDEGELRFGAVADFIHGNCRDVPVPYRWEVKEATNTLYNWLCYFVDDLEWDIPGSRSQIIRSTLQGKYSRQKDR